MVGFAPIVVVQRFTHCATPASAVCTRVINILRFFWLQLCCVFEPGGAVLAGAGVASSGVTLMILVSCAHFICFTR
ncbi:hypothetical protein O9929_14410 [Vibrio lentus]|nr:hypothetical protein [Vibrio lentus]